MALLVNLLISLLPHRRCRDQDAERVVAQAGDQARRPLGAAVLPQKTAVPCSPLRCLKRICAAIPHVLSYLQPDGHQTARTRIRPSFPEKEFPHGNTAGSHLSGHEDSWGTKCTIIWRSALRCAVRWRKRSFGTQSAMDWLFAAHILIAVTPLRMQQRDVLDFFTEVCAIAHLQQEQPSLLPVAPTT